MRRMGWPVWALALGLVGWLGAAWAQPITVTDDRGRTVVMPAAPQRVVSILPSLTETVCELQQCHRLVGVDRYSNWPAAIQALPRVGGGIDPNVEAIVALRPDVVLAAVSSRGSERLEALGLKVVALEPKTHADMRRVMGTVARVLGLPAEDAERLWRHIDAAVSAAAQSLPPNVRRTKVYFEVNRAPYAAGASSFIGETLARLGAQNIVPAELGPFPKLNPEFVVRANPDVIMVGARNAPGMTERPGWERIRAVRERRVCVFANDDADTIIRPGPRLGEGARLLADCLRKHVQP
ncbi:ABC transporter substrate-binding protein [Tepidimonas sp.]|uniref:ABC transporter substrate-binding protein n=1 Tax=Tepidimonas sp. TaxID=2002775 RepID=UPI0028CE86A8|nr:ABC transporter substrate-binding protein [Tepidimonas sp.]MDT7928181.1 ABC transporter substrate-binding protein [Tepidimonas sp.]